MRSRKKQQARQARNAKPPHRPKKNPVAIEAAWAGFLFEEEWAEKFRQTFELWNSLNPNRFTDFLPKIPLSH